jgi:hypothetical protein
MKMVTGGWRSSHVFLAQAGKVLMPLASLKSTLL